MLEKKLQKIGFSEKETKVYLEMLKNTQATPSNIAKETGLNRTTIYDIFDSLLKKGLVSKYKKKSKTYFSVLEPEKLIGYLEREKQEKIKQIEKDQEMIKNIMPEMISMQGFYSKNKPKIQFFEGEKGLREAYEDSLSAKNFIFSFADVEEVETTLPNFFPEYYKRRAKKNIYMRAIFIDNEYGRKRQIMDKFEMRTSKFFKKGLKFSPEINFYNNKVLVVSWKEKMAFIIESKEYADFQRVIFETLWENLD